MTFVDRKAIVIRLRMSLASPLLISLCLAGGAFGCATGRTTENEAAKPETNGESSDSLRAQVNELRAALTASQGRIDSLETKIDTLGTRIATNQAGFETLLSNTKATSQGVAPLPSSQVGSKPETPRAATDPEAGFQADEAIQQYRNASILHDAGKYPEAVLAFSTFVEQHPDHALAGSAQYFVGESYYRQKEYKLALAELERVLTSYDRSPRVADTLRELADIEDRLKMNERAARHRQQLTSLFPQSPAAATAPVSATLPIEKSSASPTTSPVTPPAPPPTAPMEHP